MKHSKLLLSLILTSSIGMFSVKVQAMHDFPDLDDYENEVPYDQEDYEEGVLFRTPVKTGGTQRLSQLQAAHTPVMNKTNGNDKTLLLEAAGRPNRRRVIRQLFKSRSLDTEAADEHGRTPLLVAIQSGIVGNVKALLDDGRASLDATDDKDRDIFEYAFASNVPNYIVDRIVLMLIQACEQQGCDVDYVYSEGKTLLHLCAAHNCHKSLKYLLDQRLISPNERDDNDETALHKAVVCWNKRAVEVLTSHFSLRDDLDQGIEDFDDVVEMIEDNGYIPQRIQDLVRAGRSVLHNVAKERK